jgi:hypothetical protein
VLAVRVLRAGLDRDWQDPVTSRARQLQQAMMLIAGRGVIVAEFFDAGQSRTVPWARRPQAAALVAQLADPDRGWDAIVIGEYERAARRAPSLRWVLPAASVRLKAEQAPWAAAPPDGPP